tara:strand:- start:14837 stop:15091 length:255 start_codon:yes stop_codon:yes gene_type:complete
MSERHGSLAEFGLLLVLLNELRMSDRPERGWDGLMDESTPILTVAPELLNDVFAKVHSDAERTAFEESSSQNRAWCRLRRCVVY